MRVLCKINNEPTVVEASVIGYDVHIVGEEGGMYIKTREGEILINVNLTRDECSDICMKATSYGWIDITQHGNMMVGEMIE